MEICTSSARERLPKGSARKEPEVSVWKSKPRCGRWVNLRGKSCRVWLAAPGAARLGWRENKRLLLPVPVGTDAVVSADTRGWCAQGASAGFYTRGSGMFGAGLQEQMCDLLVVLFLID